MKEKFSNEIKRLSKKIDIELEEEQIERYYKYMNLLIEWNEKINLTAITEENEIILKHFIDSMTILKFTNKSKNMIDVGTGAGFPGIPIAITKPDLHITLIDSLNKRITFLNDIINNLNLKNVKTVHGRAEELGQNELFREKYDIVTSRAVANMSTLVEYLMPFVKKNGICICMKGPEIKKELKEAEFSIKELGGKVEKIENLILPESDIQRNIIIIRKVKETPKRYPRKAGIPSKNPLQ